MDVDEIINKIANSSLVTIDLEQLYPIGKRQIFDLKDWLFEEFILKEKDFRNKLKTHDWQQYKDNYVCVVCSADAIIPAWAYMLIATYLQPIAKGVVKGSLKDLDNLLYKNIIENLDLTPYKDQKIIIKGCSNKPVPENSYLLLIQRLQPVVDSIMYGEACSTVPLWKKSKV